MKAKVTFCLSNIITPVTYFSNKSLVLTRDVTYNNIITSILIFHVIKSSSTNKFLVIICTFLCHVIYSSRSTARKKLGSLY